MKTKKSQALVGVVADVMVWGIVLWAGFAIIKKHTKAA